MQKLNFRGHALVARTVGALMLSAFLSGCGGGGGGPAGGGSTGGGSTSGGTTGGGGTNTSIPNSPGVEVKSVNGTLSLPAGSQVTPASLTVVTALGEQNVNADGGFSVPVNRAARGLVSAVDAQGNARLLQVAEPGAAVELSPRSTTMALLLLDPILASANEGDPTPTQNALLALPEFTALEAQVTAIVQSGGSLDAAPASFKSALENAVKAGIRTLGGSGGSDNALQRVTPNSAQSGVALISGDDTDPANIDLTIENSYRRHVQVWYAGADASGRAIEPLKLLNLGDGLPGIVQSPEDFSAYSVVTGQVAKPSTAKGKISIPTNAAQVRVEIWGPGFREATSVATSEFLTRANGALGFSLLLDYLGPVVNTALGLPVLSSKLDGDSLKAMLEMVSAPEFVGFTRDFLEGNRTGALVGMMKFVLTSDPGQKFLVKSASRLGAAAFLQTALKGVFKVVAIYELTVAVVDTSKSLYALVSARPLEVFQVSSGDSTGGSAFRATLSWGEDNDIDLHTFAPNGQHSFYGNLDIALGNLNLDDTDGFGPENFTITNRAPGTYRIAVNYFGRGTGNDPENGSDSRAAPCTVVVSAGDVTRTFDFTLRQSNGNDAYPIRDNTDSWYRPCDIRVNPNGSVEILAPDTSFALERGLARTLAGGKGKKK